MTPQYERWGFRSSNGVTISSVQGFGRASLSSSELCLYSFLCTSATALRIASLRESRNAFSCSAGTSP